MTCLFHHIISEDVVTVEDFDSNIVASVNVPGELNLCKASFANSFSKLVLPYTGTRSRCLGAHALTFLVFPTIQQLKFVLSVKAARFFLLFVIVT